MENVQHTKKFQLRWNEPLGKKECPYAYRFVLIFFGFSIRVHYWLRSDDKRHMHDHPWDFRTFVLRGAYYDVSRYDTEEEIPTKLQGSYRTETFEEDHILVREYVTVTAFRKANHKHYVEIPKPGVITILFCSRPYNKWGFWIAGKKTLWRPLRYFSKYGHPPCSEQ